MPPLELIPLNSTALLDSIGKLITDTAVTYGRGKFREAMAAMSWNVRGYRNAKTVDTEAAMPAFSEDQRTELADD